MIKLYAWEIPFQRLIMNVRKSELNVLKNSAFLNAGSSFTWTCAPFLVGSYFEYSVQGPIVYFIVMADLK